MLLWKFHKIPILLTFLSCVFYAAFAYDLTRTDYTKLLCLYATLFFLGYKLIQLSKGNFKFLIGLTILFRIVFLFAIPNLSQDFYRFIWDGRMMFEGLNPYLLTPESFINARNFPIAQAQELYLGMGELNGSHYTNYPPIKQFIFFISSLIAGKSILGSVIVMRLFIIAADIGILYFGKKILEKLQMPYYCIFWYLLNPFIIIELTGNLHFEGVMLFFLLWSLYLLHSVKWQLAAVIFALSVSVKLIPLLFLPLFYQKLGFKKALLFYSIVGVITLGLFLPFYDAKFISNYSQTIALWFGKFEFNASIYNVLREIGFLFRGYNEIAIIGKITSISVFIYIVTLAFFRKYKSTEQLIVTMLFALSVYFFTATTVHPWYIATLLLLSVFTSYKFPLVWSFMIVLSYLAYANNSHSENLWIIGLEYIVVYSVFVWEVFFKKTFKFINF